MLNERKTPVLSPERAQWIAFSKKIKPWNTSFFSKSNYSLPSQNELEERIIKNLIFFQANYILIAVLIILIGLLGDILLLILLLLSYFGWTNINKNKPIHLYNDIYMSSAVKLGLMFIGNSMLIIFLTGHYVFTLIGICVVVILLHASFIEANRIILKQQINVEDEENNEGVPMIFDTQIINKENYNLEVLTVNEIHDNQDNHGNLV